MLPVFLGSNKEDKDVRSVQIYVFAKIVEIAKIVDQSHK